MKKIIKAFLIIAIFSISFMLASCEDPATRKVSVLTPTGTPSLGIADAISDSSRVDVNIVNGADPLKAGFTTGNYDIIVAPVNLGAMFYNNVENFEYVLYKTIVWGNYYLASLSEINSIEELNGKTVVVFGQNSTPDVVLRTIIASKNLNVNLEYVDDVATANSYLLTGKAEIIVSAEPSLTKVKSKKDVHTFDLQQAWFEFSGNNSLPQAAIFVKASLKEDKDVLKVLSMMEESVLKASSNPTELIEKAVSVDSNLNTIGKETLQEAIAYCNLKMIANQKEAIEFYFNKVIELGIGKTVGGKLPDEGFYFK